MLDFLSEYISLAQWLKLGLVAGSAIAGYALGHLLIPLTRVFLNRFFSQQVGDIYQKVVTPYRNWMAIAVALASAEVATVIMGDRPFVEIGISLVLTIVTAWTASRLIQQYVDGYLIDAVVSSGKKVNELIVLIKVVGNVLIAVVAIILFAQAHELDVFGLLASLGIGGLAIAFAAQKTLEQFLGGIVIYLDKPFTIDDYVGLPDGTFGKVESIGLRSTRIRSSGKGTLIVVPNNALTQMTIENFTGGKKVMAIVYLNFEAVIPENDEALIRQVILDSTTDIYGIDSRNTDVKFRRTENDRHDKSQAQITFFILGSGEGSMELRRQVLDIANQTLTQTLKGYGIAFEIEEPTYVDSPITI